MLKHIELIAQVFQCQDHTVKQHDESCDLVIRVEDVTSSPKLQSSSYADHRRGSNVSAAA